MKQRVKKKDLNEFFDNMQHRYKSNLNERPSQNNQLITIESASVDIIKL